MIHCSLGIGMGVGGGCCFRVPVDDVYTGRSREDSSSRGQMRVHMPRTVSEEGVIATLPQRWRDFYADLQDIARYDSWCCGPERSADLLLIGRSRSSRRP